MSRLFCVVIVIGYVTAACMGSADARETATQAPSLGGVLPSVSPSLTPSPTQLAPPSSTVSPSPTPEITIPTATPLPAVTPSPTALACWRAGGRIVTGSLETELLRTPLQYRVYLPPCYDQQPKQRYPVLYLMHGQSYTDDQWDRLGVDETADDLIATGEIPPLMIVMPYDRYGGQPVESNFGQAVVEALIPHIDRAYRTRPDRSHRAVGGLSRGAGWAIHFAFAYSPFFGALGAHSPAVFHSDAVRMRSWLDAIAPDSYPRIYLDIGDKDRPEILRSAEWFEELLNQRDIPHEWHLFSGYHSEAYWSAHLAQYLKWYTQEW